MGNHSGHLPAGPWDPDCKDPCGTVIAAQNMIPISKLMSFASMVLLS